MIEEELIVTDYIMSEFWAASGWVPARRGTEAPAALLVGTLACPTAHSALSACRWWNRGARPPSGAPLPPAGGGAVTLGVWPDRPSDCSPGQQETERRTDVTKCCCTEIITVTSVDASIYMLLPITMVMLGGGACRCGWVNGPTSWLRTVSVSGLQLVRRAGTPSGRAAQTERETLWRAASDYGSVLYEWFSCVSCRLCSCAVVLFSADAVQWCEIPEVKAWSVWRRSVEVWSFTRPYSFHL